MTDTGQVAVIVLGLIVVFLMLPPRYDPAFRLKEWLWRDRTPPKPSCYADYPFLNGQEAAERDCRHCSHASACHEDTPIPSRKDF